MMSASASIPPGLILMLGAVLVPLCSGTVRSMVVLGIPLVALWAVWMLPDGVSLTVPFLVYELQVVEADALSRLFGTIFTLMAFGGGLFALNQKSTLELAAAFAYSGGAVGVALAGDLITVFIFWEIMAVASTLVVWSAGTPASYRSSMRYLQVHLAGGVILMAGVIAHVSATGSVDFVAMQPNSFGTWMILIGFLINAGAPPFSAWLPDAYPEASFSGMVFLSAFTTKTAVYVLIRGYPGAEILIFVGMYMILYGIIYALLENDMRRILSYSIVNQVGFMVCGIGIGTVMSLNGAAAHAFTHIIYKALLLMSAGSVLYMTGKRKCTDLGGLFQSMPLTAICGIVGALAISSFPLTSGFISKSMIAQAAADEHIMIAWFVLAAGSAGVFLHAGIKFPWFVFFQKDSGMRPPDPPMNMRVAMVFFAFLCIGLGVWPEPLYAILPFPVDYAPYTVSHVVNMLQLLLFAGLAFFLLLPMMKRTLTISLDFDWFYRVAFPAVVKLVVATCGPIDRAVRLGTVNGVRRVIIWVFRHHGPESILAATLPAGSMVLWVIVVLAMFLVLYFI
ncbi:MAG: Na(+)/H(+) antiporter subunit D [Rhodospirillales bacterium]|jgi:multicomponent Na+:H+ antiporter subunit D|nr:Na(+)/H(+) antiporter subunit D [Rhodospirillales bacterium]